MVTGQKINNFILNLSIFFFINIISVEYANAGNACLDKSTSSLEETSKACDLLLEEYESKTLKQVNWKEVRKAYFKKTNALFKLEKYEQAKKILFRLKSNYNNLLEDSDSNYQWFYLMGKVKIRTSEYHDAILDFKESLKIAYNLNNNRYISHSLNGLGLGYQKLNQYELALTEYKESLTYRMKYGDDYEISIIMNNIANMYNSLENYESSAEYFLKAVKFYQLAHKNGYNNDKVIAHYYENVGIAYNKLHQYDTSIEFLSKAKNIHDTGVLVTNKVQVLIYLAKSYLKMNNNEMAYDYFQLAIVEDKKTNEKNAILRLELALYFYKQEDLNAAKLYINQALEMVDLKDKYNIIKPDIYQLKSEIALIEEDYNMALMDYKIYTDLREKVLKNKSDQNILNVSHTIEIAQNHHELLLLEKENKLNEVSINRHYWIIFSLLLSALIIIAYIYQVIQKYKHEKAKLLTAINQHKHKLIRLEGSTLQLKEMFTDTSDAILCINSAWISVFHNEQFLKLVSRENEKIEGIKLKNLLPDLFEIINRLPLNDHDMPLSNTIKEFKITINDKDIQFNVRVNTINLLDDFTVFAFGQDEMLDFEMLGGSTIGQEKIIHANHEKFRISLVELMQGCVQIWRSHTKTNRIELAEASGFWNVSIDDGRLRTRALDRYLDLKHLPAKPRWRQVIKTTHYILSEQVINTNNRDQLNSLLENFMQAKKMLIN